MTSLVEGESMKLSLMTCYLDSHLGLGGVGLRFVICGGAGC